MNKEQKDLIRYIMILPREIEVEVNRAEEGGFWARALKYPGLVTQAENFFELTEMLNDAILVYFDVPEKFRKELGYYVPKLPKEVRKTLEEKIHNQQMEKIFSDIVKNRKIIEFDKV